MVKEIREIYTALARAAETGDPLRIGLAVGQVLPKLEEMGGRDFKCSHHGVFTFTREDGVKFCSNCGEVVLRES